MNKLYIPILVSFACIFISTRSNATVLPQVRVYSPLADIVDTNGGASCISSSEELPSEILLAKQGKEKYNCIEVCSKDRYQCETKNNKKDKIGKKKHIEGSRDCENLYRKCLDKCE